MSDKYFMANKLMQFRIPSTLEQKLQDILLAKAHAYGMTVAYGTYAPRRNGLCRSDVLRELIEAEWQKLYDDGSLMRARVKKCMNCGRTDCSGGYFCGY